MEETYQTMLDQVHASDRLRQEVMNMTNQERHTVLKKISRTTIIAAALIAALAGSALAAGVEGGTFIWFGRTEENDGVEQEVITGGVMIPEGGGEPVVLPPEAAAQVATEELPEVESETRPDRVAPDTIQGWHEAAWKKQTQQETMPEGQEQVVEVLTVPVGVSDTCNRCTVMVDSVTVEDSSLWVLLKFDGDFAVEHELRRNLFGTFDMHFYAPTGEKLETRMCGYSSDYASLDSQGNLTTMLHIDADFMEPAASLRNGCTVELSFMDLMDGEQLIQDGNWTLRFDLAPMEQEQMMLTVDSAEVAYLYSPLFDENTRVTVLPDGTEIRHCSDSDNEERFITLRNIQVSTEAIRFTAVGDTDSYTPNLRALILADGTEIRVSGSANTTNSSEEGEEWVSYWKFPVDLSQVVALRFSEEDSGSSVPVRDTVVPLR